MELAARGRRRQRNLSALPSGDLKGNCGEVWEGTQHSIFLLFANFQWYSLLLSLFLSPSVFFHLSSPVFASVSRSSFPPPLPPYLCWFKGQGNGVMMVRHRERLKAPLVSQSWGCVALWSLSGDPRPHPWKGPSPSTLSGEGTMSSADWTTISSQWRWETLIGQKSTYLRSWFI